MMTGDTVLITGGTGLLGEAIAVASADAGLDVIVTSREYDRAEQFTDRHNRNRNQETYYPVELDLRDENSIADAVAVLIEMDLLPSALIANASNRDAIGHSFDNLTHADFANLFEVDVAGHVLLARELRERANKSIQNVTFLSSIYAHQGVDERIYPPELDPTPIHYAAVKAAFEGVVRNLAARWSPKVRVNAVVAGGVRSQKRQSTEFAENYSEKTMIERMAGPREIAEAVVFLASERASYITAESLYVDGGYRSW